MAWRVSTGAFVEADVFVSDGIFSEGCVEDEESTVTILGGSIDSSDLVMSAMNESVSCGGGAGFVAAGIACAVLGGDGIREECFAGTGLASMRRIFVTVEVNMGDTAE